MEWGGRFVQEKRRRDTQGPLGQGKGAREGEKSQGPARGKKGNINAAKGYQKGILGKAY